MKKALEKPKVNCNNRNIRLVSLKLRARHPREIEEMAVQVRDFITYIPPPQHPFDCEYSHEDLDDEIVEWKERMKYFHDDIDWLLRLPGAQFWEQITKDNTFSQSYDSFWQFCPRPHDMYALPSQCLPIHNQMKKVMLLLFLRICDDSEKNGLIGSSHACVIYDNFLIDVPKIIDICSIYASAPMATKELISKALCRIFQKQQGYWNDLDIAVDTILKTFDSLSEQFSLMEDEIDSAPRQLGSNRSVQFSNEELNDALVYLYDTFSSLVSLLYFCGPTSSVFLAQGVLQRAAMMVDKGLPRLRDRFQLALSDSQKRCFSRIKKLCLQLCNAVLKEHFFKQPNTAFNKKDRCHEYLDVINTLLPETRFVIEYEKRFNMVSELNSIDVNLQVEFEENITFIKQVLNSILPDVSAKMSSDPQEQAGATAGISDSVIESIVLQVKAMMPDEDDAFLRACVVHFEGDPEKVVNHLLEGNIPPFLQEIKDAGHTSERKTEPLEIDLERMTPANQLPGRYYLKSEVTKRDIQDEIFQRKMEPRNRSDSSAVANDHDYTTFAHFDEYDDEYDDTYDSHNVGAMDADSGDELKDLISRRSTVKPRVLQALETRNQQSNNDDEESDDEDDGDEDGNGSKEATESQTRKDEKKQVPQPYRSRPPYGRGRDHRGGDRRRQGHKDRQDNAAARAQGDRVPEGTRGRGDARSSKGRGRGGHVGKKHNQKSLALKKSARGMGGL